jgi:Ca-activated chloride channel family protein
LALYKSRQTESVARRGGKPLTPLHPTQAREPLRHLLSSALIALIVFALATTLAAQSGRVRTQPPSTTVRATRPRPAATPAPSPTPQPSASPASTGATKAATDDEEVSPEDVVKVEANLVTIPASVVDTQGKAVTDLKLEDFELKVEGLTKQISDLSHAETPVRMVLLFDNSQSLRESREFEKQAAVKFLRRVMRPIDQTAIYSIYTYPILAQPFTSDVNLLVRTIEGFPTPEDGATALFDTMVKAANLLRPFEGRKVMVIVSDGADTMSELQDFDNVLQRMLAADCQIYAVQTGQSESANLYNLAAYRRLQEFTAQTGGAVYVPKVTNDLDTAFDQIAADLAQQYVLSYYPNDDKRDGRFRTISLKINKRPNLRVRARKGYYPPKG